MSSIRLISRRRTLTVTKFAIIAAIVLCMGITIVEGAPARAATKTDAWVQQNLRYGLSTAIAMDYQNTNVPVWGGGTLDLSGVYTINPCYQRIDSEYNYRNRKGKDLYGNGTDGISVEETSASYRNDSWVSYRNSPNVLNTPTHPGGAATIPLQVNNMTFTCRPFAKPIPNVAGPNGTCSMYGRDWLSTPTGWIKTLPGGLGGSAFDTGLHTYPGGAPNISVYNNDTSDDCFVNGKVWFKVRPTKFEVVDGLGVNPDGTPRTVTGISMAPGTELTVDRDDASRFWSGKADFSVTLSSPLTTDTTLTIRMYKKKQNRYYGVKSNPGETNASGSYGVCYNGPAVTYAYPPDEPGWIVPWDKCEEKFVDYTITIKVNPVGPQWETQGTSSVLPTPTLSVGTAATWTHRVMNLTPPASKQKTDSISYHVEQQIGGGAWTTVGPATDNFGQIPVGATRLTTRAYTAQASDVGKSICQRIVWNPWKDGVAGSATSVPACVTVTARPLVQVWGHDARVGGDNFNNGGSATSTIKGSLGASDNGSWAEYGVLAPGCVTDFASGHGLNGTALSPAGRNQLTFANAGIGTCMNGGNFTANVTDLGLTPATSISNYFTVANGYTVESDLSTLPMTPLTGTRIIKNINGTITIDRDIKYATSATNADNLPQLIIIAKNIKINQSVKQIDAWLIASETIDTCGDVQTNQLRTTNCNEQLKINGPVMTRSLLLERTTTPPPAEPGKPAETIDLRSDAYIWTYAQSQKKATLQTTYITELPPRF
jgi:hypothetical protein